jgi:hypothetical protein
MKQVRACVGLVAVLGLSVGVPRMALAQSQAVPVPAASRDVQQVRDEVARLKREFDLMRQQYDERLLALEQRLSQIGGGPSVAASPVPALPGTVDPAAPVAPPPPQAAAAPAQNMAGASKVFNPDNSIIANFVGAGGKNKLSDQPSLQMTEVEAAFQAVVDPYARADFFLSAGPGGLEVEEGYITFTTLPHGLLLKVGQMRASFGKVNSLHTHAMPTVDRPLVTQNLVGGEEGISDAGLSLSHLIQNPFLYLEVTGEVFRGGSEVFQSSERSRLNYVGRVRAYRDLTEATNIDLGTSFAHGPTDIGLGELVPVGAGSKTLNKRLIGIDATFHYRPLRRAIYQRLNLRTELIWSHQDLPLTAETHAFGVYGLAEYQFARRWYVGGRVDRSGRVLDGSLHDSGGSFFLTYWPSEFSQIRCQFRRTSFAEGITANEFLFQVNFAIGAHGAHVF